MRKKTETDIRLRTQEQRRSNYFLKPSISAGGTFNFAGETIGEDGVPDFGYFGPGSVAWRVLAPPAAMMLIDAPAAALEFPHRGLLGVVLEHDPLMDERARLRFRRRQGTPTNAPRRPFEVLDRHIRTGLIPSPIISADRASADHTARRLHAYHKPMKTTVAGRGTRPDETYDAASAKMMLFAHVTIFHSFLRLYETVIMRDGRLPTRLPENERTQYWVELSRFAELMGVPTGDIPRSSEEVAAYYRSIEDEYLDVPVRELAQRYWVNRGLFFAMFRPSELRDTVRLAVLGLVAVPATLAAIPRPVRRLLRLPRLFDPLLDLSRAPISVLLWPLQRPAIAERVAQALFGRDARALFAEIRISRQHCYELSGPTEPLGAIGRGDVRAL